MKWLLEFALELKLADDAQRELVNGCGRRGEVCRGALGERLAGVEQAGERVVEVVEECALGQGAGLLARDVVDEDEDQIESLQVQRGGADAQEKVGGRSVVSALQRAETLGAGTVVECDRLGDGGAAGAAEAAGAAACGHLGGMRAAERRAEAQPEGFLGCIDPEVVEQPLVEREDLPLGVEDGKQAADGREQNLEEGMLRDPSDLFVQARLREALGWGEDTGLAWRRLLDRVRDYSDLEPALLGRVEELIDFVTAPDSRD